MNELLIGILCIMTGFFIGFATGKHLYRNSDHAHHIIVSIERSKFFDYMYRLGIKNPEDHIRKIPDLEALIEVNKTLERSLNKYHL